MNGPKFLNNRLSLSLLFACLGWMSLSLGCMFDTYVPLEPIGLVGEELVVVEVEADFYQHVQQVLAYYGEEFQVTEKGEVQIKASLARDKDLMRNYTTKAQDPDWLAAHP